MIERRGDAVKNLVIHGESHDVDRRASEPHFESSMSDKSLFQKSQDKILRIRRDTDTENNTPSGKNHL